MKCTLTGVVDAAEAYRKVYCWDDSIRKWQIVLSSIYRPKYASFAIALFPGERNGKKIGSR